jgi:peroxiredoxin Q/BCP
MAKLKVGDKFPALSGETVDGEIAFKDFKGKNLVVYFYPKDNTPGCTKEAKDFRDYKDQFDKMNTEIIGISTDSLKSHTKFKEKYGITFPLLSDKNKILCSACGVTGVTGKTAKRTTFLLDKSGKIRHIWEKVDVKGHAEDVLATIKDNNLQ